MKKILIFILALVLLVLAAEGIYWLSLKTQIKELTEGRSQEETVGEKKEIPTIVGNLQLFQGNILTLEVKGELKQIALNEETTIYTDDTLGSPPLPPEKGREMLKTAKKLAVGYQESKEGPPLALSILIIE